MKRYVLIFTVQLSRTNNVLTLQ